MEEKFMRLWTIQPPEVMHILEKNGEFTCDTKLSENYKDFYDAYLWLVQQMDNKNIYHPKNLELPLWAWHTFDGKHEELDLENGQFGIPNKSYVCIEFEISDKDVLLSDYNAWHYVLNNSWNDDSTNEEEWEKMQDEFDKLDEKTKQKLREKSWQKIFDIEKRKSDWNSNGYYVQATFWKLEKSMIKKVRYFMEKDSEEEE